MPGSDPLRRFQAPQTYLRFPYKTHEHCALPQVVHLLLSGVMSTSEEPECSSSPEGCLTPAASVLSKDYCYSAQIRSSVLQGLPFGGVPTVLVLNFMCFLVSLATCSACRSLSRRSRDFEACFNFALAGAAFFVLLPQKSSLGLWTLGPGQWYREVRKT